ncbi:MAG: J domain-containing protein [Nitrosomonadales bacterium]|nr:J domain-containing protein [Nitrosomonadales bacterium]
MTDPYRILGVPVTADDEAIRAAYLAAIRNCPPERDRKRFERVRAAYEAVSSVRGRLSHALFDKSVPSPEDVLDAVVAGFQPRRVDERRLRRVLT